MALPGQALSTNGAADGFGENVRVKSEPEEVLRIRGGAVREFGFWLIAPLILKQSSNGDMKPIIPPDRKPEPNAAGLFPGDEVIDSDLDDSDDELRDEGEGGEDEGEVDIVFCVYDKVSLSSDPRGPSDRVVTNDHGVDTTDRRLTRFFRCNVSRTSGRPPSKTA